MKHTDISSIGNIYIAVRASRQGHLTFQVINSIYNDVTIYQGCKSLPLRKFFSVLRFEVQSYATAFCIYLSEILPHTIKDNSTEKRTVTNYITELI